MARETTSLSEQLVTMLFPTSVLAGEEGEEDKEEEGGEEKEGEEEGEEAEVDKEE